MPASSLLSFRKNIYSQNGEDGVLEEILRRLGIRSGWACEFGAWDGKHLSNTYQLLELGWQVLMIEGNTDRFKDLLSSAANHAGRLHALQALVLPEGDGTLDCLLAGTPIPRDFEVLSIDIDSCDYQVWRSVREYRPKIVVIEINSSYRPGIRGTHGEEFKGSTFTSTLELGHEKGYRLACHTGNMIFVREDLFANLNLPAREVQNPDRLFVRKWLSDRHFFHRLEKRWKQWIGR